jgi:membrane protein required for colicin V production
MLSFIIVLVVSFIVLLFTALYTFRYVQIGGRLQYMDKMIGTFLGLLLGAFFACLIAMLMNYIFVVQFTASTLDYPAMKMLQGSTERSTLKGLFLDAILPLLYGPISPVLPDSADAIFGQLSR